MTFGLVHASEADFLCTLLQIHPTKCVAPENIHKSNDRQNHYVEFANKQMVPPQKLLTEIGKAKQAYEPMAPGFPKLWAISKKYGPLQ